MIKTTKIKQISIVILCLVFFVGCAKSTTKPIYPTALNQEIREAWNNAENLTKQRKLKQADNAYKLFIETYGYNSLTDRARFKRGEISFVNKDYNQAIVFYRSAYENVYSSEIAPKAQFKIAYALFNLQKYDEALKELKSIKREHSSSLLKVRMDSLGVFVSKANEEDSIKWNLYLIDDYIELANNKEVLKQVNNIVLEQEVKEIIEEWIEDSTIESSQIKQLPLEDYKGKNSGSYAYFKLGKTLYDEGKFVEASNILKSYVYTYPKHEYYSKAQDMLSESSSYSGDVKAKIGLLLPLSGKYSVYGESVLHGIECAAGIFKPCKKDMSIQLITKDTQVGKEMLLSSIDDLLEKDVMAIIGPILSATSYDAGIKAQDLGIPMISISQREDLLDIGDCVFRNTVTSKDQVEALVDYAISKKGLRRFLILYPENKKGQEYKDLFTEVVQVRNGDVVAALPYTASRIEIASSLMEAPFQIDLRKLEYDAVFIPDSYSRAGYLIAALAKMGIKSVQYLGISRWDNKNFIEVGGKYVEGAVFPEAFFKDSIDFTTRDFVDQFRAAYGIDPTLLEALGYDSMKLITETIKRKQISKRTSLKNALYNIDDVKGATGELSFTKKRDIKRKLPILTISNGAIVPIAR